MNIEEEVENNHIQNVNSNETNLDEEGDDQPLAVVQTFPELITPQCSVDAGSVSATTITSVTSSKQQKTQKKGTNMVNKLMVAHKRFLKEIKQIKNNNNQNQEEKSITSWKNKLEEIDCKLKCVKTYKELKKEG